MRTRSSLGPLLALTLLASNEWPADTAVSADDPFLDTLGARTFRYFWELANPANGLVPVRAPTPSFANVAAVGFGLTAYPVGVEPGYVTRPDARQRVSNAPSAARKRRGDSPTVEPWMKLIAGLPKKRATNRLAG